MRVLLAEALELALAEAKNGTVGTFLVILSSHLTQYDQKLMAGETKRGGLGNIYRLGHYLDRLGKISDAVKAEEDSAAPEALAKLKAAILKQFFPDLPPVKKLIKQIDDFLTKGKLPSVTIQRRRRAPAAMAAESTRGALSSALLEAFA